MERSGSLIARRVRVRAPGAPRATEIPDAVDQAAAAAAATPKPGTSKANAAASPRSKQRGSPRLATTSLDQSLGAPQRRVIFEDPLRKPPTPVESTIFKPFNKAGMLTSTLRRISPTMQEAAKEISAPLSRPRSPLPASNSPFLQAPPPQNAPRGPLSKSASAAGSPAFRAGRGLALGERTEPGGFRPNPMMVARHRMPASATHSPFANPVAPGARFAQPAPVPGRTAGRGQVTLSASLRSPELGLAQKSPPVVFPSAPAASNAAAERPKRDSKESAPKSTSSLTQYLKQNDAALKRFEELLSQAHQETPNRRLLRNEEQDEREEHTSMQRRESSESRQAQGDQRQMRSARALHRRQQPQGDSRGGRVRRVVLSEEKLEKFSEEVEKKLETSLEIRRKEMIKTKVKTMRGGSSEKTLSAVSARSEPANAEKHLDPSEILAAIESIPEGHWAHDHLLMVLKEMEHSSLNAARRNEMLSLSLALLTELASSAREKQEARLKIGLS